jgi:hypothetical protein
MKHLHTFSQHLNESQSLPEGCREIDKEKCEALQRSPGPDLTKEEREAIVNLRDFSESVSHPESPIRDKGSRGHEIYITVGFMSYFPLAPHCLFGKSQSGVYYLMINNSTNWDQGNPTRYFSTRSLFHLIEIACKMYTESGAIDTSKFEWIKIK